MVGECLAAALMIAEALGAVHAKGFVHCDFKIDNIVVETTEENLLRRVSVIDFGMALREGGTCCHDKGKRFLWHCHCFYSAQGVTGACDLVGLGVLFKDLFRMTEGLPRALWEMATRMQRRSHAQRPQITQAKELLRGLLKKETEETAGR